MAGVATDADGGWEWLQVSDEALELHAAEKGYRLAPKETRYQLLANPKVRAGLDAYFERHERYNGNLPTISADEALHRLDDVLED